MKHFWFLLIIPLLINACGTHRLASQSEPVQVQESKKGDVDFYEQSTWILGFFKPSRLQKEPYSTWYNKGFEEYVPKTEMLNRLLDLQPDDITIKIIMGTWCPDSRREVPRFMKIMDLWHFPADKLTFIGVDINKVSPIGDFDKLGIERVPTFIVYKNNIEEGRIIEVPKTSLEQDLVEILTKNE
jgi:thiol-disulfide isomerase/thioredoxin